MPGPLAAMVALPTPETVWAGFDPAAGPLEEEVLRRWTDPDGGVVYKEVFFSAFIKGETVRVYGQFARPADDDSQRETGGGGALPALLHMHGGGQTVAPHYLSLASRGYCVLSINCHGEGFGRPEGTYTVYPDSLPQGRHQGTPGELLHATQPDLTHSSWFLWAAVNRRALTYLAAQPAVDAGRMGIFGISMGGTSVWPVAMDPRVKAACAIYGIGWDGPQREMFDRRYDSNRPARKPSRAQQEWDSGMAAQACPPYIRCPLLFLNASNDQHGNLDYVFDTFESMPADVPWRVAITPRFRHHIAATEGNNLLLWFETWLKTKGGGSAAASSQQLQAASLWPATPLSSLVVGAENGIPMMILEAAADGSDANDAIEKVSVYYNVGQPEPKARHWREVQLLLADFDGAAADKWRAEQKPMRWEVQLPTPDVNLHIVAFANVHYKTGIVLTSSLVEGVPSEICSGAKATEEASLLIYNGSMGVDGWLTESPGTDPSPDAAWWPGPSLSVREGPGGVLGIGPEEIARGGGREVTKLLTYKIGDPRWSGPDGARLSFKAHSTTPQEVGIKVADAVVDGQANEYEARVAIGLQPDGGGGWQQIVLALSDFSPNEDGGQALRRWKGLLALWVLPLNDEATAGAELVLTDFEWLPLDRASL